MKKKRKNLWSIIGIATCVACFFQVAPIGLVEGGHKTKITLVNGDKLFSKFCG